MRRSKPLSPFGSYLVEACRRAGLTPTALAKATGTSSSVMSYCLRSPGTAGKRFPPPLDRLVAWSRHLALSGEQKDEFMRLAYHEHLAEPIRQYVARLEEDNEALRRERSRRSKSPKNP